MKEKRCKLSVIMPVYNEEEYIAQALESVLYQEVTFDFEVIIVDDGSTDKTAEIVRSYQASFSNIILIVNEVNRGKGYCFTRSYEIASGEYFNVLDGDDIFIRYDKLQRQVDFLDNNDDYVAVAHNSVIFFNDQRISFSCSNFESRSYTYWECVESIHFHCYASAYMFRKIHEKISDPFLVESMANDSMVYLYHVFHSKKKVMYYPDIASLYNFHGKGLWSGLCNSERRKFSCKNFRTFLDLIVVDLTLYEYSIIKKRLDLAERAPSCVYAYANRGSMEEAVDFCMKNTANVYTPSIHQQACRGMYGLRIVDQFCEAIGRILLFKKGYILKDRVYDEKKVAILFSGLILGDGDIVREIQALVQIQLDHGKYVDIFSSNLINTDKEAICAVFPDPRVHYWQGTSGSYIAQIEALMTALYEAAPSRIYPFIAPHDVILNAALQRGLGERIIMEYVYDYGLSLGVSNSSIDKMMVKTASQIHALSPVVSPRKCLLIPLFLMDAHQCNPYQPLRNGALTTASAEACPYKVESDYGYEHGYRKIIPHVLKITGGTHYHYGPLSEGFQQELMATMDLLGVQADKFVHIQQASELAQSLLQNGVDVFLSPWPTCSARVVVEVMSCGIPLLNHKAQQPKMPQAVDFCDPNQCSWEDPSELCEMLRGFDFPTLSAKSVSARSFFEKHNEYGVVQEKIMQEQGDPFVVNLTPEFVLEDLQQADFYQLDNRIFVGHCENTDENTDEEESMGMTLLTFLGQIRYKLRIRTRIKNAIRGFLQ